MTRAIHKISLTLELDVCMLQTFVVDKRGELIFDHQPPKGSHI